MPSLAPAFSFFKRSSPSITTKPKGTSVVSKQVERTWFNTVGGKEEERRAVETCPRDDDDEAAALGELSDEVQMLTECRRVRHQVRRHGGLSLRLLKAAL